MTNEKFPMMSQIQNPKWKIEDGYAILVTDDKR